MTTNENIRDLDILGLETTGSNFEVGNVLSRSTRGVGIDRCSARGSVCALGEVA